MLGNVRPVLNKLSQRDRDRYSAYYCGLCDSLGSGYGVLSRMMLNYDMVFIAMVCDDLNREDFSTVYKGCIANPFKKKNILKATKGTRLAADVLTMLAYYKVIDNIQDEKWHKKLLYAISVPYFYLKYRKAKKARPQLAQVIDRQCRIQPQAEKDNATIDKVAMPTAKMCAAIFRECAPADAQNRNDVAQFGFFLGRVIYLLDALKDMDSDREEGKFNIFNQMAFTPEDAAEECFMALGEMSYWYRQTTFEDNGRIIENIIYLGLGEDIHFTAKGERTENGTQL